MIDGVLLKERDDRVHGAAVKRHEYHPEDELAVGSHIRDEVGDAEPFCAFGLFLLVHAPSSSPMDICMS